MAKKPQTNVQFVKEVMEFSNFGPMAQLFVMWAIEESARQQMVNPFSQEELGLVDVTSWQGVAQEIYNKFQNRSK